MKRHLIFLGIVMICFGCGTDTGNPGNRDGESNRRGSSPAAPEVAYTLVTETCSKLSICHEELSQSGCSNSLWDLSGLGQVFSQDELFFDDLRQVKRAEREGAIEVDYSMEASCLAKLNDQDCETPEIQAAYQAHQQEPYAKIEAIFDISCRSIYRFRENDDSIE